MAPVYGLILAVYHYLMKIKTAAVPVCDISDSVIKLLKYTALIFQSPIITNDLRLREGSLAQTFLLKFGGPRNLLENYTSNLLRTL